MSFELRIKKKALKFISSLRREEREKLKEAFLVLKSDPVPVKLLDIAKLKGEKNTYRIRVGKVRIVYVVLWKEKTVLIHRADFREKVYRGIG